MKKAIIGMIGCALLTVDRPALANDVTEQMRQMLTAGQSVEAYRLGQENEKFIGDADFDFLFGQAALEGGRVSEGVLALERYRMTHPGDDSAWLTLIRGYILQGEDDRALAELEDFLAAQPDKALSEVAREYLDLVRNREEARHHSSRAWLETGLGYDSNINGGPGSSVVNLPIFGQITLDNSLTETSDAFAIFAGGFAHQQMLKPGLTAFFDADAGVRGYFDDNNYDQTNLGGKGGLVVNRDGKLWRTVLSHQSNWLDGCRYLSASALGEEWVNPFAADRTVSAFVQYARFDFGEKAGVNRDADFWGTGLGWRQLFAGALRPRLTLSLTLGDERNNRNRDDLSRLLMGGGAQLNLTPAPQWGLNLGYAYHVSHYEAQDRILFLTREDENHTLSAGATYFVNTQWSVQSELSYATNHSNIDLNDYDRTLALVKVRYDFR